MSLNSILYSSSLQQIYLQFLLDFYTFLFYLFCYDTLQVLIFVCPTVVMDVVILVLYKIKSTIMFISTTKNKKISIISKYLMYLVYHKSKVRVGRTEMPYLQSCCSALIIEKQRYLKIRNNNRHNITWILHHIFMYSNKVILQVG